LRNLNDSPRLPEKVVRQAIASFSPPEWVELDVRVRETTEVSLHGQLWRMKVTYSGDDLTVKSVHTPWSRSLDLRRASTQVASGAAKEARP
jgi:hypothetical protein